MLNSSVFIIKGNTPLHYAACGGFEEVVHVLIEAGANVEEHNENGHTPLMEAASAGHVGVARILLDAGAGINTHSNEFKESALTLACYKGKTPSTLALNCWMEPILTTALVLVPEGKVDHLGFLGHNLNFEELAPTCHTSKWRSKGVA